jgi:hypothetical protein
MRLGEGKLKSHQLARERKKAVNVKGFDFFNNKQLQAH